MNHLQRTILLRYCKENGLDSQEIDSTLTYWENKNHLQSIVKMLCRSLDTDTTRAQAQIDQYMDKNALTYYAACHMLGETISEEIGEPDTRPPQFSLRNMTTSDTSSFSLRALAKTKRLNERLPLHCAKVVRPNER